MRRQDIGLTLPDRPGALADFGQALGGAGVSLEGGGVFTVAGAGVAHFLVDNAAAAQLALEGVGLGPVAISDVVTLQLRQAVPGQLGLLARQMADAGVNIAVQYSDHDGNLIVVVPPDHATAAYGVANAWAHEA
jgi:hypothetical protein